MIILNDKMLRQLQFTELELLKEVDRICRKNEIQYSLDGGTLLGAIRHKGFIPWDDDADIMMLRNEYDKFFEACRHDLDKEKYMLQEFRTDPAYRWGYSKLRKNNTVFLREGQEHIKCHTGVCIDIFIFDEVPDRYVSRYIHWGICQFIRKGLYSVVGMKNSKSNLARVVYLFMSFVKRESWEKMILFLAKNEQGKGRELVSHLTYPNKKSIRFGLKTEYFKDYIDVEYETCMLRAIKSYDAYLIDLFGDYMVLPPAEERKVHPVSKLEL